MQNLYLEFVEIMKTNTFLQNTRGAFDTIGEYLQ